MSLRAALTVLVFILVGCEQRSSKPSREGSPAASAATSAPPAPGRIRGTVRLEGDLPAPAPVNLPPAMRQACGEVLDASVRAGQGGALADAVVWVAPLPNERAAPAASRLVLDQRGCRYWPPVLAANGAVALEILNSDPLLHNVRAHAQGAPLFNFAMPVQGMKSTRVLHAPPGEVVFQCDVHPWMRAILKKVEAPAFAVTDPDGKFELVGVLPGRRRLLAWHPRLPERVAELTVEPGAQVTQDVVWHAKELTHSVLSR